MKYKIEPPYYPVVYVRGYAMTSGERDDTFHDTYYGFAATSVEKRDAPPLDYFRADLFEGQLIRFMKLGERAYYDATNRGLEDCADNPSRSLWASRRSPPTTWSFRGCPWGACAAASSSCRRRAGVSRPASSSRAVPPRASS